MSHSTRSPAWSLPDFAAALGQGPPQSLRRGVPDDREFLPKRRPKKGQPTEVPSTPECSFERLIGPPKVMAAEPEPEPELAA